MRPVTRNTIKNRSNMEFKKKWVIVLLLIIGFIFGFYFKSLIIDRSKNNPISKSKSNTKENRIFDQNINEIDFSEKLHGKFILEGADYAGFEFIDSKTISWTNEMFPMDPDTMRLKWIDKNTFVATLTKNIDKKCPPRDWIRKVVSYDGSKLVLKNIWTGWEDSADDDEIFDKE